LKIGIKNEQLKFNEAKSPEISLQVYILVSTVAEDGDLNADISHRA